MNIERIVGLGLCVIDHIYRVEDLALGGIRTRFSERREAAGGMTATALRQVAALGCDAQVLSVVGDDSGGRQVRRELRAAGVKTRRLLSSERVPTTVAVVLVDRHSGERRFLVPDRRGLESRAPAMDLSVIDRCAALLVDGHFPDQALRAVRRARRAGAMVIGDFARPSPGVSRLLPHVDHAIVPLEFSVASGDGDPRETLERLADACPGRPAVTLGERGGIYLDGHRLRRFRAHRTRVVDTTGAGDLLHGAFAVGRVRGMEFEAALDLGARAAALGCSALGGAGRFMTQAEMRAASSGRRRGR